jgi:hypothetical protein
MQAYEAMLNATSTSGAPWYAIPADNKAYMRMTVADIVRRRLEGMGLSYPRLSDSEQAQLPVHRAALLAE